MKLFELFATLGLDSSGFDSGLKGAQSKMNKAASAFKSIGSGISSVGNTVSSAASGIISSTEQALSSVTTMATGATAAVTAAIAAIGKQAYDVRANVEQGIGGADAVFGSYADTIAKQAEGAWETAGLSMEDYYATANKMGALFQGSGFSQAGSVDLTTQAMQRAADVASIMGISVEDAMYSIAGAAKGNFTMLDNLGVPINDTILAAYALQKGMDKSVESMTIGEKVGLAMQKFMEDTAYAAGNYAKENETAAGSMATLQAAWSNFLAGNLGFDEVVDSAYNAMSIALKTVGLEAYQPFLDSAKETVDQAVKILGMQDGEVDENGLTKSEKLRQLFTDTFKNVFDDVAAKAPEWMNTVFTGLTTAFSDVNTVLPSAMNMATDLFDSLRKGFQQLKDPLLDGTETIAGDTLAMFAAFKADMLTTGLEFIGAFAQGITDDLNSEDSSVKKALGEGISNVVKAMGTSIPAMGDAAINLIKALADSLTSPEVGAELSTMVSDLIGSVGELLVDENFWSNLGDAVLNIGSGLLTGIFDGLGKAASGIWDAIVNGDDGSVPESVKALQESFTNIMTNSKAAEDAYSSAMSDIQARADLAEKYLAVLREYEKLENPDEEMTKAAQNATQALVNLYPDLKENVDSNTGVFNTNTEAIRANIQALQDLAKQQAYQELTNDLTKQQADLIKQKVEQQQILTQLQVEQAKAQQQYDLLLVDSDNYLRNGTFGENRAALNKNLQNLEYVNALSSLMADKFGGFFDRNADGTATAKNGISSEMWDTFWSSASSRLINAKEDADNAVAEIQTTMAETDTAIATVQTRIGEMQAAWTAAFGTAANEAGTVKTALDSIEGTYTANIVLNTDGSLPDGIGDHRDGEWGSHASGLGYVPYDNYLSRLHRGEMVLTRQQAEGYRQGSSGGRQYAVSTSLNVGSMTLNNGMDAQRVAQALSKETTRQVRALGRRKG